jgi:AcrR family transcriptional regulator
MTRGFTDIEKNEIRRRLIEEFENELRYQKINKISIDDLVSKVGIAKGSFYLFFKSKEYLFVEVINKSQEEIISHLIKISEKKDLSEKEKLKKFFNTLIKELQNHPWLHQMTTIDFEKIVRRLPEEMKDDLRQNDVTDIKKILSSMNLTPKYPLDKVTVIMEIILSSVIHHEDYGSNYNTSVKLMSDILIDNLFETDGG